MNVLVICDVPNWAIGKLANIYIERNKQFKFKTLYVHPKEVQGSVIEVANSIEWADVIIMEYWNTAKQLMDFLPELKAKKLILMHHNQKNLLDGDWSMYTAILCHTKKAKNILNGAGYENVFIIPYGLDFDYWKYIDNYPANNDRPVIGYAGRIVPWKNLKEVSRACSELGYQLLFMGKMDKGDYWASIPIEQRDAMDTSFMNCPDRERLDFYHHCDIFVNFCSDGREEGTLPLQEAMAAGIPVITTPAGVAADIITDGQNGLLVPFEDYEALKASIKRLAEDLELRQQIRKAAWNTIRNYTVDRMAWRYSNIIYAVNSDQPLVSVVLPVHKADDNLKAILQRLNEMDHKNVEVVVCDDSVLSVNVMMLVSSMKDELQVPIKYVKTSPSIDDKKYGLAEARNRGIIEAQGEYIMFLDSRMLPDKDAISVFLDNIQGEIKSWLFGDKGANKTSFVENFSFIRRQDIIDGGMFNERIDQYGGMSQEVRERFTRQGIRTGYVSDARATQLRKSSMTPERRRSIIAMKDLLWKINLNK